MSASSADIPHDNQTLVSGDGFLSGVLVMLCVNAVQRVVGLVRNLGFCWFLSEEQLGAWALANSFLAIAVPVALLGLTGSFGRFVEHYRRKGQLGDYLVNVLGVATLGIIATVAWMWFAAGSFGWLVFNQPLEDQVVLWCILTLLALLAFSIVYEIVASLREVRVMSLMQFLQSVVFAIIGLPMIAYYGTWTALLPCFMIACGVACLPGVWVLYASHRVELSPQGSLPRPAMWKRILPFAGALWVLTLLGNLFEICDRTMLLHLSATTEIGQAYVGQYHCGRILPNLMFSVALMLSGVLLPFVSADWEAGKTDKIQARLRQMLNSMSIGFMAISVVAMLAAPMLFELAFAGRYEDARLILPLVLAQTVWLSLYLVIQTYMFCSEKIGSLLVLQAAGLIANLGLNWVLISRFGLSGAVSATAIAGLVTLIALHRLAAYNGCDLGGGSLFLCIAPAALLAGPSIAMACLVGVVLLAGRTQWVLTASDRQDIDATVLPQLERVGIRLGSLWP